MTFNHRCCAILISSQVSHFFSKTRSLQTRWKAKGVFLLTLRMAWLRKKKTSCTRHISHLIEFGLHSEKYIEHELYIFFVILTVTHREVVNGHQFHFLYNIHNIHHIVGKLSCRHVNNVINMWVLLQAKWNIYCINGHRSIAMFDLLQWGYFHCCWDPGVAILKV